MEARALNPEEIKKIKEEVERDSRFVQCKTDIENAIISLEKFQDSLRPFKLVPPTEKDRQIENATYLLIGIIALGIVVAWSLEFSASPETAYRINNAKVSLIFAEITLVLQAYQVFWKQRPDQVPMWKHQILSILNGKNYNEVLDKYQDFILKVRQARNQVYEVFSKFSIEFTINSTSAVEGLDKFLSKSQISNIGNETPAILLDNTIDAKKELAQILRVFYFSNYYQKCTDPKIKLSSDIIKPIIKSILNYDTFFAPKVNGTNAETSSPDIIAGISLGNK